MTRLLTSVAAAALLALPALAQAPTTNTAPNANQGKPPSPAAESTQKAPEATTPSDMTQKPAAAPQNAETAAKLNAGDRNFVESAASSGTAEVEMAKHAADKARNPAVKDFAKMMAADHGKVNDKLTAWAKQNNVEVPKELKPEHKRSQTTLSGLSGAELDRAYMDTMVQQHQKSVQLFTHESTAGQNAELKQFAADTLPTVQQHLKLAQQIAADLNKTATTTDKPATAKSKPAKSADTTLEQGSTDRNLGAVEPAAGKKKAAKSAQRGDPESARIAELNRQQLQRLQGQTGQPQR